MNLKDELEEILIILKGEWNDHCFYVGRDYREEAINMKHYKGFPVVYHPLVEDDMIHFAPEQNWN